jgi:hypothetical protein
MVKWVLIQIFRAWSIMITQRIISIADRSFTVKIEAAKIRAHPQNPSPGLPGKAGAL